MPLPSFSVVTPSFNQVSYIRANVESVLAQNYPLVEHIVIDNDSTDGTVGILQEYSSVNWTSEEDRGQSDAINKAIERGSNEWIVWVNSDDFLLPGCLASVAEHIKAHPGVKIIYSNIVQTDEKGSIVRKSKPNYSPWKLSHWWWGAVQLWQPGTIIKREVFKCIGPLDVQLHYAMDFDFFLKAQDDFQFNYLDADLVAFRLHSGQKGHATEEPFIDERINTTLRYWKRRNRVAHWFYAWILYFVRGSLLFTQGLIQYERGNRLMGLGLIKRGLRRNPFALFRPEHLGFWVRKLVGRERYYRYR